MANKPSIHKIKADCVKAINEFPIKEILDFSSKIVARAVFEKSEDQIAAEIVAESNKKARTQGELLTFGKNHGLSPEEVGTALKDAGLGFEPDKWNAMEKAILEFKVIAVVPAKI